MTPNIDIIKDFSRLQSECRALGESNVHFAQENAKLRAITKRLNSIATAFLGWHAESLSIGASSEITEAILEANLILSND